MLRPVHIFNLVCLSVALPGCSTLGPDPSIRVDGNYRLTWNDVREIERLLRFAITFPMIKYLPLRFALAPGSRR
jgi:hypothetical protein